MTFVLIISLFWFSGLQERTVAPGHGAFIEDVIRSMYDVHDTRTARAGIDTPDEAGRDTAIESLKRSSDAIARRMDRWVSHPNARIRDVASYVRRAATALQNMAAAFDDLRQGRESEEAVQARLRGEREVLGVAVFSTTLIGTSDVVVRSVRLTAREKASLVRLITTLFPTNEYAAEPEVFAVRALKSRYE